MALPTDSYWEDIAKARGLDGLRVAISRDAAVARDAFPELCDLISDLKSIEGSTAADQLQWLAAEIAEAAGEAEGRAEFIAQRLHMSAMKTLHRGDKKEAVSRLAEAASISVQAGRPEQAVRVTATSVKLLYSLGEFDVGLNAAEDLLRAVEGRIFDTGHSRAMAYELAKATRGAPAGDRWASVLARIEAGMRRAGDEAFAAAVARHLAETLIRSGAYEDGGDLLAEAEPILQRMRMTIASGEWLPVPESSEAHFWRARGLDLRGSEAEAELAYRSHPSFVDPGAPENNELTSRLVELLIENDRLQEALDIIEPDEPQDPKYRSLWRALLSKIYALLNRTAASQSAARDALSRLQADDPKQEESEFRRMATEGIRASEQMFESAEMVWRLQLTLAESATVRREAGSEEIGKVKEALAWARRLGDRPMEARCYQALGKIELDSGRAEAAIRLLQEGLECELAPATTREWQQFRSGAEATPFSEEARKERYRRSRTAAGVGMQMQLLLGRARVAAGTDPMEALDTAIGGGRRRNRRLTLYSALAAKAGWLSSTGHKAEARPVWSDAAAILESLRAELSTIESQIGLLEDKERVYAELLAATVETGEAELAIRLMERAKARAFLEQIRSGEPPAPLSAETEARARELRQQLVRLTRRQEEIAEAAGDLEIQKLKNRFAALYRGGRQRTQPAGGALGKDVATLSSSDVSVVEYFVSEEHVFAVVAHRGELASPVVLPVRRDDLEHLLDTLQFEIGVRERCRSLESLYDGLFAPVERSLRGASRLLMVPHGVLHRAPLHALRGPDGVYLAQRFTVQYAPSVAVAQEAARRPWTGPRGGAALIAANQTPYCSLPPLCFAGVEADEVAKSLPGARVFAGMEAVRRHMIGRQHDLEILHCACHGEYDSDDPLLSRLYLADGPVYGYEIERLRFRPRIVVLSACESGVQKRLAGDETFGLVRALLSRGAETVIASLWKVGDESTARLMGSFYRERATDPDDAAGALRRAQLELLASPRYAHPFFWAPYFAAGATSVRTSTLETRRGQ